ncbi:aldolase/citrate lyase family protein [Zhenpiania hominis]|uniref:Aldolase n=1 Tax=Zhenpiania hominis TaxID=2763644 RepID=A0A923NQ88_9FIRM|nr:aldolase/citrate lyase family protein [Zhenpiania hominis]MBC6681094.1 aldolase [Zhenpiania hominis]
MSLKLMYITNNLDVALIAQQYGVDRIWIDLETLGKKERQKNFDSVKSNHKVEDIIKIKGHLTTSEMLVRINQWHAGSIEEINAVVAAGADLIMLPYWKTIEEVKAFIHAVAGRSKTVLLLETKEAVDIVDEVLDIPGISEIHIGLNDLHISYGLSFMFELLTNGVVEMLCKKFSSKGLPYGFGGIARIGTGAVPAEYIVQEHYRLGSTRAILSRTFCNSNDLNDLNLVDDVFRTNMEVLRNYEKEVERYSKKQLDNNKKKVTNMVQKIVLQIEGEG